MDVTTIKLTELQSEELFSRTGHLLRRLGVDSSQNIGFPIDECCTRCLLASDLPNVQIQANGLCNHCTDFEGREESGEYSQDVLNQAIVEYSGSGDPNCVLAFSGGKDSALALVLAVQDLNLRPIAVLVDNGFIPDEVIENGRNFCKSLGVELVVRKIDITEAAKRSLEKGDGSIPCTSCITGVFAEMAKTAQEADTRLVLSGHRFPPLVYPLSAYTRKVEHEKFRCISPLLSRKLSERHQLTILKRAGWERMSIVGNTSNCKLIALVEDKLFDQFGYNPHLYEVSKEIRAGFFDRTYGYEKIRRPEITKDHKEWVHERLGNQNSKQSKQVAK